MAQLLPKIIDTVSKPSWKRSSLEVNAAVPWLQKKSDLLGELDKKVLQQIVRNCACLRAEKDDVIITQGDTGDKLYIILSGLVSVYVDQKKALENHAVAKTAFDVEQKVVRAVPSNRPGSTQSELTPRTPGFSDTASQMSSSNNTLRGGMRVEQSSLSLQPTIAEDQIAEETPDLTEVTVQCRATSRRKYGEFLVKFASGRCFGEIALIRPDSLRNATIIADEDCIFLVIKRYLYNTTLKSYQEEEYADRAEFVQKNPLFKTWHPKFQKLLEMSLIKETYSYNEAVIRQGDDWKGIYFLRKGKAEVTIEPTKHEAQYPDLSPFRDRNDVFEIELGRPNKLLNPIKRDEFDRNRTKALDSIFVKRHDGYVAAEKRLLSKHINLCTIVEGEMFGDIEMVMNLPTYFHNVTCCTPSEFYVLNAKNFERLVTKKYPNTVDTFKLFVETKLRNRSSSLQGQHVPLLKHLLFRVTGEMRTIVPAKSPPHIRTSKELPNKSVLFEHLVSLFKENKAEICEPIVPGAVYMREKMREKARYRQTQKQEKLTELRKKRRLHAKGPPVEKPRTMKELKAALERQRLEEEEVERRILLEEVRAREEQEIKKMELNTLNLKNFVVQFQDPVLLGHNMKENANNSNGAADITEENKQVEDKLAAREKTFITEIEKDLIQDMQKAGPSNPNAETQSVPEGKFQGLKTALKKRPSSAEQADNIEENMDLLVDEEGDPLSVSRQGFVEELMLKNSEEPSRAASKMKFVNALLRKGVQVPENPQYRDWETNNKSMEYLEERIKRFAKKHGEKPEVIKILPKLKRFESVDESSPHPRPGGKVIVKPKQCIQRSTQKTMTDHSHVTYHMVPKIKNYENLKKAKMVFQKDLEMKRENWVNNKEG